MQLMQRQCLENMEPSILDALKRNKKSIFRMNNNLRDYLPKIESVKRRKTHALSLQNNHW